MEENKIIELSRQIGELLQQEDCYKKMEAARIASDADIELQNMINQFGETRTLLNEESMKKDRDTAKIYEYNTKMREIYDAIMNNEYMKAYNEAKLELDGILNRVNAIINQSAQGEDPKTTDYHESCHGNCASCGGC